MSEMVERVARRLADVHFRRKMHYGTGTQDERVASLVEAYWRNHVPDARAAIAAMREPTDELDTAFADALDRLDRGEYWMFEEKTRRKVWQSIIDEMLK